MLTATVPAERHKSAPNSSRVLCSLGIVGARCDSDLTLQPKGHPIKVEIARELRKQTPMTRRWIAQRLRMGARVAFSTCSAVSMVSSDPKPHDLELLLVPIT